MGVKVIATAKPCSQDHSGCGQSRVAVSVSVGPVHKMLENYEKTARKFCKSWSIVTKATHQLKSCLKSDCHVFAFFVLKTNVWNTKPCSNWSCTILSIVFPGIQR